jgi:hypothetical protein
MYIPDRQVRLALPSTLNPVVKQRTSIKIRPFRAAEYDTLFSPVRQVVASNSLALLASAQLLIRSDFPLGPGDPNASNFDSRRKGLKPDHRGQSKT